MRGHTLFGFFSDENSGTTIAAIPVYSGKGDVLDFASGTCEAHCRHHISAEKLWFFYGPERATCAQHDGTRPTGRSLPALQDKYERERGRKFWPGGGPGGGLDPARGVAIDFVPVSDKALRVFFFVMKTKKIESWETEWALQRWKNPRGFNVSDWKVVADERDPETIDSAFAEDFYVFKRKADYYFVTQSGKLYVAPPLKKGEKSRTMKALWDDAKRPIAAVIEDANREKVWLFAKDKNAGAKLDLYFEMKDTIRTESFDPTKLRPVNAGSRAKTLLEYWPLISTDSQK